MIRYFFILLFILCPIIGYASDENEKLQAIEALIQKHGLDNVMQQFIAHEHEQLPIKKDKLDTITSVMYVKSTKAKIYKHVLTPGWEKIISDMTEVSTQDAKQYMPGLMQQQLANSICSNKLNQIYLKHGAKIVNVYSDADGNELFTTTVKQSDCGV
ncbi:hypothetical protein ATG98_2190 [Marinobacter sp. LV10R520-4]|jgi:hypothetical protein|uniref:hypothetical protein n=1 Tax=Marinobacter sp. LV10R520-4 TaxID=1761796 RepID=UPI000BF521CC|nr:hypothetical protein [Marinobacter sp. LV10R520-4]PFG53108.1 hypothetical protein ATG98_2190 [Marinobacter sp. LV10R520-4]